MNKLYKVKVEMMAIGVDEDDARYAAGDADIHACDFEAEEITDISECLDGWESALPWGEQEDDFTCAEFLKKNIMKGSDVRG